jgi:aryl-alcohol dehydrogenase-like predicted oxidoreductase
MNLSAKLCLGTVQLGLPYGIANQSGQPDTAAAFSILDAAHSAGVGMLDTGRAYGSSEEVIGAFMAKTGKAFKVVTKLPRHPDVSRASVETYLRQSLSRLGLGAVHGYLIHDFEAFQAHPEVWDHLLAQKDKGAVGQVGISAYYPREVELALSRGIRPDIVQLPLSVLDARFAPLLPELKRRSIEVHARSVFLQGAVFLPDDKLKGSLLAARDSIRRLRELSHRAGVSVQELCLKFVARQEGVDRLIIGVDSAAQLRHDAEVLDRPLQDAGLLAELRRLAVNDEAAVVPSQWSLA